MFNSSIPLPSSTPPSPSKLALRPEESQLVTTPDGRTLGFAIYGSLLPSAPAIFPFHGLPGFRITARSFAKVCRDVGAKLVAIDLPG
jgi:hypothetical protein